MEPIRVQLVDPVPFYRDGLRRAVQAAGDCLLLGEACDVPAAVEQSRAVRPEMVLFHPPSPGSGGLDGLSELCAASANAVIVLVYGPRQGLLALSCGARGICRREVTAAELPPVIEAVARGEVWVEPRTMARLATEVCRRNKEQAQQDRLTCREREILARIGAGDENEIIARQFSTSELTVRTQVHQIMEKLDIHKRQDLSRYSSEAEARRQLVDACLSVVEGAMVNSSREAGIPAVGHGPALHRQLRRRLHAS